MFTLFIAKVVASEKMRRKGGGSKAITKLVSYAGLLASTSDNIQILDHMRSQNEGFVDTLPSSQTQSKGSNRSCQRATITTT